MPFILILVFFFSSSLEDFDVEEEDEEALIEQRRQQRLAIVEVSLKHLGHGKSFTHLMHVLFLSIFLQKLKGELAIQAHDNLMHVSAVNLNAFCSKICNMCFFLPEIQISK